MEIPSDSNPKAYQESSTFLGALIIPPIYFSESLPLAHKKYQLRLWGELLRNGDYCIRYDINQDSPYLEAVQRITEAEFNGDEEAGSSNDANAALYYGTFDETVWAQYLPENRQQ